MAGPLHELLFGGFEVQFESDYPLAESVQRLQDVASALSPAIRGTVAETYVSIHRADPPTRQDFRPWFFGRFVAGYGKVVLRGRFAMHDGARIAIGLWLAACLYALFRSIGAALDETATPWLPLLPLALLIVGVLVPWLGMKQTRGDPAFMKDVIAHALTLPH